MKNKLILPIFVIVCAAILFIGIYSASDKTYTLSDELKSALKDQGVSTTLSRDGASSSFLSSSSCDMLWLDDEKTNGVMVAFYSDDDEAYDIADNLDFTLVDFTTSPNFYLYENSIVTYFGTDTAVLAALSEVLGSAFVEGSTDASFY